VGKFLTTTSIDCVSSMTVFNGKLYIGTTELNSAEVYRYDGSATWTQINVTNTAGKFLTTTSIDGVSSMIVYGGAMYIGTQESQKAEIYRFDGLTGGNTWALVSNATAGTIGKD